MFFLSIMAGANKNGENVAKNLKQRARLRAAGMDDTPVSSIATTGRCNTTFTPNHAHSEHFATPSKIRTLNL